MTYFAIAALAAFAVLTEIPMLITFGVYRGPLLSVDNYTLNIGYDIMNDYSDGNWSVNNMIATVPAFSFLFKYYIGDKGAVLRWSKMHKVIEAKFKQLKAENA